MAVRLWRRRPNLRPIPEEVAYARCHGERGTEIVRVVKMEPRRPRYDLPVSGETLRRAFEDRLGRREHPS
jgi:hypothetical protein